MGKESYRAETHKPAPEPRNRLLEAALSYAKKGVPIIALHNLNNGVCTCSARGNCETPGKHPRWKRETLEHGVHSATTDPGIIRSWWDKWPRANVAIATGAASGLIALDADPRDGGDESLETLRKERGLPETLTANTGKDGFHLYLRYSTEHRIGNSVKTLGPGLDTRGEAGYVVAPPSCTAGPYRWAEPREIAEAPAWLIEELAVPADPEPRSRKTPATKSCSRDSQEELASEMGRNDTLTRLAGSLVGRGATPGEVLEELELRNAEFSPPLAATEVYKVAKSSNRWTRGERRAPHSKRADPETLEALSAFEERLWAAAWPGMGGKGERDVLVVLVKLARRHGKKIPAGVKVSISIRSLALEAATSKPSCLRALRCLREAGWVRRDDAERRHGQSGAFVLLTPEPGPAEAETGEGGRANLTHSASHTTYLSYPYRVGVWVSLARGGRDTSKSAPKAAPFSTPRLRWSAPTYHRDGGELVRETTLRFGKTAGAVLDTLERSGGEMTIPEVCEVLGIKRPRDLRRRSISRLEEAGVIEVLDETLRLSSEWLVTLEKERENRSETEADERDQNRYERERDFFKVQSLYRRGVPFARIAERAGIPETEVRRILRSSSGVSAEPRGTDEPTRPAPAAEDATEATAHPPDAAYDRLLSYMRSGGRRVMTARGPAALWQLFSAEVRVIFEVDTTRHVGIPLGEVLELLDTEQSQEVA